MKKRQYGGLVIETPEDWLDASQIVLVGSGTSFAPNVTIVREELGSRSLEDHKKRTLPEFKRYAKKFRVLEERPDEVNGHEAYVLEASVITPDRVRARQSFYFIKNGDELVVVTLACADDDYAKQKPVFDGILGSLRFE